MKLATLALALSIPSLALAHTRWSNGDPIPSWVKSSCCGPADAHHLEPSQVHDEGDYYTVDGYTGGSYAGKILKLVNGMGERGQTIQVPNPSIIPSQDGDYWIFYNDHLGSGFGANTQSNVYCFFVPMDF